MCALSFLRKDFPNYLLLDQKVCQLSSALESNVLSYTHPQNLQEEKKKFFEMLDAREEYNPVFIYAPRNPLYAYFAKSPTFDVYKRELKELLSEVGRDSLGIIFEQKILDLFDRLELVRSVGTPNFSSNAESYYGTVDSKLVNYSKELLKDSVIDDVEFVSFDTAKTVIESFLKKKKLKYKLTLRSSSTSKFSVNIRSKDIFIEQSYQFTKNSLRRLIAHEIEAHVYRYENGLKQPYLVFSKGLSKETLETEEGLAVVVEKRKGINVDSQLKQYAGRVYAITLAQKKSFYDTFINLTQYFSKDNAFDLTLRAKRGMYRQDIGGAFTKDALYLKGMLVVEDYLKEKPIESLYYGRYSVFDAPYALDVDGLKKPKYLPDFSENNLV